MGTGKITAHDLRIALITDLFIGDSPDLKSFVDIHINDKMAQTADLEVIR